jgi:putative ABC transport system ATP-binding protein
VSSAASIELDSVSKEYETPGGLVRAVENVSARVEAGTSLAITGPSGCGKSTLLALIGGLDLPTTGHVAIGDRCISALGDRDRTRIRHDELGFVFQADNLLPFLTATENVALQLSLRGVADGYDRCVELLARLGLADCHDKLPDQLSGGQRQRVAIARALVHEPRVVLADEPTGSLDPENAAGIVELLLAAQRERQTTLVVVTHDPGVARQLDRTLTMRDGRLTGGSVEPAPRPSEAAGC